MKSWIKFFCGCTVLFSACNKNLDREDKGALVLAKASTNNFFVSDWEQTSQWNTADSSGFRVYSFERQTPELTSDVISKGVVIAYSKINLSDPDFIMFNKPVTLPFYFLPVGERPANAFYWYESNTAGRLKVSYRTGFSKTDAEAVPANNPLSKFQFRYFIISKTYLDSKGVEANTVKYHYNYQQLLNFLGLKA